MASSPSSSGRSPAGGANNVLPYRMHVSQRYLDLTRQKLELARLPREPQPRQMQQHRDYGVPKAFLERLVDHWAEEYNWRAQEALYNESLPQYRLAIHGTRIHFVHRRSMAPNAIPLLFVHGWPESFITVANIIDALCNPVSTPPRGNASVPSFHVVVPSIPGFGFSDHVSEEGNNITTTAEAFDALMKSIGYPRYIVHGSGWYVNRSPCAPWRIKNSHYFELEWAIPLTSISLTFSQDNELYNWVQLVVKLSQLVLPWCWTVPGLVPAGRLRHMRTTVRKIVAKDTDADEGLNICRMIALTHNDSCVAIHTCNPDVPSPRNSFDYGAHDVSMGSMQLQVPGVTPPLSPGRFTPQSAHLDRPQTISYALCDSPVGLLAYIVDAIRPPSQSMATQPGASASPGGSFDPWTPTSIICWAMLYWLPGPEAALRWMTNSALMVPNLWIGFSNVPLAVSQYEDHSQPPQSTHSIEAYHRVVMVRRRPGSVRFPTWERPGDVAQDLRDLAKTVAPMFFTGFSASPAGMY